MRQLYLCYPNFQTLSGKLSWSHYCELLGISEPDKRAFYEKECLNSSWSVRELKRQIESSLFERLLLSKGDANKIIHAYVLFELKTKKLTPEAAGQINMYLNYYAAEVNEPGDNPPIGIILCTDKDDITAEYVKSRNH